MLAQQLSIESLDKGIGHIDDAFGYWFSGFSDGEASFILSPRSDKRKSDKGRQFCLYFTVAQRADDLSTINRIRDVLCGIGAIYISRYKSGRNPMAFLRITRIYDLYHIIVPLFDKYPLQSKKKKDYVIWREAVELSYYNYIHYYKDRARIPNQFYDRLLELDIQLKETRVYREIEL